MRTISRALLLVGLWVSMAALAPAEEANPSGAPVDWPEPILDSEPYSLVLFNQIEYRISDGVDSIGWDALAWFGGDYRRLWIETEGEDRSGAEGGEIERFDVQYGRLISPFWDLQAGIGYQLDYGPGPDNGRLSALIGIQGLAPQRFEVDANLRISEDGDVSADLEAEYEMLITQRWVLQPRFETAFAFQEVEVFEIGEGFNSARIGLRLRYEARREIAPYIGVTWSRQLGETADIARRDGSEVRETAWVVGLRAWF